MLTRLQERVVPKLTLLASQKLPFSAKTSEITTAGSATAHSIYYYTPPVSFWEGDQGPTALQWLRRRGPYLPVGTLFKLFRKRKVQYKELHGGKLRRAAENQRLSPGAQLAIPWNVATCVAPLRPKESLNFDNVPALEHIADDLKSRILYRDKEVLIINKPPGLPVHSGSGLLLSLDKLAGRFLKFDSHISPRLVHRLDKDTSGALILARNADAATWLSAAFRKPAESLLSLASGQKAGNPDVWVKKTYWAIVETSGASLPSQGKIDHPVFQGRETPSETGLLPALTLFSVLKQDSELAWLQLQPVTGRKHQLRLHCARHLGAPIRGDRRYGAVTRPGSTEEGQARSGLLRSLKGSLCLHCHSVEIKRPGKPAWTAVAPLPPHMAADIRRWN